MAPTRTILATRPLAAWRSVDLVTAAFLGVALGVVFWGWSAAVAPLTFTYAPLGGLFAGGWLLAGVVGGLVIRRPGAALFVELVAAAVEVLLGSSYGWTAMWSGLSQGLGAELVFALLRYRRFGLAEAALAGAVAFVPLEAAYERTAWLAPWSTDHFLVYCTLAAVSGAVIAGVGGWALTRALAKAGALRAFPAGQEVAEGRLAR